MKTTLSIRGAIAASIFLIAQAAHAHALPKIQQPAAGATLANAPAAVSITFSEMLEPVFSSLKVTDASGRSVVDGKPVIDMSDRKTIKVQLAHLASGKYSVEWVAVASDGHRTQGHYSFSVK